MKLHRLAALCLSATLLPLAVAAPPLVGGCPVLPPDHVFNTRIDTLPVHPQSSAFLATIGLDDQNLHLDLGQSEDASNVDTYWGIPYNVVAGASLPWAKVYISSDGAADESDCGRADGTVVRPCTDLTETARLPIPAKPLVEGGISSNQSVYNDHHILTVDADRCMLWESYLNYLRPDGGWNLYSAAAFDLRSNALRPAGWTSSDAAGFPILPLLLRADEASAGEIRHALRFTIQSNKIRESYAWPARHLTTNGDASASKPPMGQLFRLRADYPIPNTYTTQAKAILTALKRYGMYIADGGSDMYITGNPSRLWQEDTYSQVQSVPHTAFEAVDLAPVMARAGFNPDSAQVPAATGAPAEYSAAAEGSRDAYTLWASLQVAQGDQGKAGQVFVVVEVPGAGYAALTERGEWVRAGDGYLPPAQQTTLGTHLLPVLRNFNITSIPGAKLYLAYGTSLDDMLTHGKVQLVHVFP